MTFRNVPLYINSIIVYTEVGKSSAEIMVSDFSTAAPGA
jgi:hypothetical protein